VACRSRRRETARVRGRHPQGVERVGVRRRHARGQVVGAVGVEQEAHGAQVHAVERDGQAAKAVQGAQHRAVPAQDDQRVRALGRVVAVPGGERGAGL